MDDMSKLNGLIKEFTEIVPEEGTHLDYLFIAGEIRELYSKVLAIMEEEEETPENLARLEAIEKEIEQLIR